MNSLIKQLLNFIIITFSWRDGRYYLKLNKFNISVRNIVIKDSIPIKYTGVAVAHKSQCGITETRQ